MGSSFCIASKSRRDKFIVSLDFQLFQINTPLREVSFLTWFETNKN